MRVVASAYDGKTAFDPEQEDVMSGTEAGDEGSQSTLGSMHGGSIGRTWNEVYRSSTEEDAGKQQDRLVGVDR